MLTAETVLYDPLTGHGIYRKNGHDYFFDKENSSVILNKKEFDRLEINYYKSGIPVFSLYEVKKIRNVTDIIIDPGHGGKDPGAMKQLVLDGKSEVINEKDIVLILGKKLKKRLESEYPEINVSMTRNDDTYPTLENRIEHSEKILSASSGSALFISLHVNASLNLKAKGFEVWYLPEEYRRKVLKKNEVTTVRNDVYEVLNSIQEQEISIWNKNLARYIAQGLESFLEDYTENRGLKEQIWYVVRKARMPSVLVEIGFLSNREELILLQQDDYISKISVGIAEGVRVFIDAYENKRGF